jgi:hypothetical protein
MVRGFLQIWAVVVVVRQHSVVMLSQQVAAEPRSQVLVLRRDRVAVPGIVAVVVLAAAAVRRRRVVRLLRAQVRLHKQVQTETVIRTSLTRLSAVRAVRRQVVQGMVILRRITVSV